jgi:hypothetical protein
VGEGDDQGAYGDVEGEGPPGAGAAHLCGEAESPAVAECAADEVLQHVARRYFSAKTILGTKMEE